MRAWIISIAGVCILSVVVDLILPSGKTNSHIKNMMSYVIVLVVLAPLPSLKNGDFSFNGLFKKSDFTLQYNYIYNLNQNKLDEMVEQINKRLENEEIYGVTVSISANIFENNMVIDAVYVDLYNLVISQNTENINIQNNIKKIILEIVDVREDMIIFYE